MSRIDYFLANQFAMSRHTSVCSDIIIRNSHDSIDRQIRAPKNGPINQSITLTDHKLIIMSISCKAYKCTSSKLHITKYNLPSYKTDADKAIWYNFYDQLAINL
jgi:hypothetical protein